VFVRGRVRCLSARALLLNRQAWEAYEGFQRRKKQWKQRPANGIGLHSRVARAPAGIAGATTTTRGKPQRYIGRRVCCWERVSESKLSRSRGQNDAIDGLTFAQVDRSGDPALVATDHQILRRENPVPRTQFHLRRGRASCCLGGQRMRKDNFAKHHQRICGTRAGSVRLGANVKLALVAQDLVDLDPAYGLRWRCAARTTQARTLLSCLKVRLDCLNRPIGELSAGEQMKVALARVFE